MRIQPDSDAYLLLMRGNEHLADLARRAEDVLFSAALVGKLTYGFRRGAHHERKVADLGTFLEIPYATFLGVRRIAADRNSSKAAALGGKERPVPTNDVWAGAQVVEKGADVTSTDSHFEHVCGIVRVRVETD